MTLQRKYEWFAGLKKVGTGPQYTPTAKGWPGYISLQITVTKPGHTDVQRWTTHGPFAVQLYSAPDVLGTERIEETLEAANVDPPYWVQNTVDAVQQYDGIIVTYQWLRDGKVIVGATADTYQLVTANLGKRL